jgi:hypothetical protein
MTDGMIVSQQGLQRASVALEPVMDVQRAKDRMAKLQEFCAHYLQESTDGGNDGGDYGVIPGAGKKKVLLKSGADKLCDVYGLADTYTILTQTNDFETGLFEYTIECRLQSKVDDSLVGSGLGSCSSFEAKYRFRGGGRTCPTCSKADTIIKGKAEYGGGWICFTKKGGCGAKFKSGDQAIESQDVGRVENPDIIDSRNTVLKMAKKRAKIDAVIGVTRSSGIFTQDMEDFATPAPSPEPAPEAPPAPSEPDQRYVGLYTGTATRKKGAVTIHDLIIDGQKFSVDEKRGKDWQVFEGRRVTVTYHPIKGGMLLTSLTPETVTRELTEEEVGFAT